MSALKFITQTYLNKFSTTTKLINRIINKECKQIIIIPSYSEPELEKTLLSLTACLPTNFITEVIIILNSAKGDTEALGFNQQQKTQLEQNFSDHKKLIFNFILTDDLPIKHAGVGLARKIGMDEAIRRFTEINFDGLLICLDADCTVNKNYLIELEKYAEAPESYNTICLNFEHVIENEKNELLKKGIIYYELFLRYYKEALSYCGFPYAFYTIGSSMAVKASVYCKAGGMNKRKAGEDFYFLNKIFQYGKVIEVTKAIVYPSARISTRVPFGTGRAQQNFVDQKIDEYKTYAFQIFEDIKYFFSFDLYNEIFDLKTLALPLQLFLMDHNFEAKLIEIKNNTTSKKQFTKRFFDWFDSFLLLKLVHYARDNYYPNNLISEEVKKLLVKKNICEGLHSEIEQLTYLRKFEKDKSN